MSEDSEPLARSTGRILLLCALVLGFLLREASPDLEPYPAVLLPAGPGVVARAGGEVSLARFELVGIGADGDRRRLDPESFFEPIPVGYWTHIARRGFGVSKSSPQEEALAWLRERAEAAGVDGPRAVRVRYVALRVDVQADTVTGRRVVESIEVPLVR